MIAIVTVDDNNGTFFNHRRQSRDAVIVEKVLTLTDSLLMDGYSAKLFPQDRVKAMDDFLDVAGTDDYCFVEGKPLAPYIGKIQRLIVFRWNRVYPADTHCDIDLADGWTLASSAEFKGTSHEKITMEVYERCDVQHG
nr:MAG TPA: hypothetical protein [Caudoviricetes sp.]